MKYREGTRVKCFVGYKPTEVFGTICADASYLGLVNMRGKSLVEFDKPIKMGEHLVSRTTLSNSQISRV